MSNPMFESLKKFKENPKMLSLSKPTKEALTQRDRARDFINMWGDTDFVLVLISIKGEPNLIIIKQDLSVYLVKENSITPFKNSWGNCIILAEYSSSTNNSIIISKVIYTSSEIMEKLHNTLMLMEAVLNV